MNKINKPLVLIDTNLLISAIITKSNSTPATLLTAWRNDSYNLLMSEEIMREVENVLRREKIYTKYHISLAEIDEFLTELRFSTRFVIPVENTLLPVHSRDPKDDVLLASAISGNCDYLITGDEDLLILNHHPKLEHIKILTAAEFLTREE